MVPTVVRNPNPTPLPLSVLIQWPRSSAGRANLAVPATGRWSGRVGDGLTLVLPTEVLDAKVEENPACWGATKTLGGCGVHTLGMLPGMTTGRPQWLHHPAPELVCFWNARKERCLFTACPTQWCFCTPFVAHSLSHCIQPSAWTLTLLCLSAPLREAMENQSNLSTSMSKTLHCNAGKKGC